MEPIRKITITINKDGIQGNDTQKPLKKPKYTHFKSSLNYLEILERIHECKQHNSPDTIKEAFTLLKEAYNKGKSPYLFEFQQGLFFLKKQGIEIEPNSDYPLWSFPNSIYQLLYQYTVFEIAGAYIFVSKHEKIRNIGNKDIFIIEFLTKDIEDIFGDITNIEDDIEYTDALEMCKLNILYNNGYFNLYDFIYYLEGINNPDIALDCFTDVLPLEIYESIEYEYMQRI